MRGITDQKGTDQAPVGIQVGLARQALERGKRKRRRRRCGQRHAGAHLQLDVHGVHPTKRGGTGQPSGLMTESASREMPARRKSSAA
jgi:hypothetical protein